MISGCKMFGGQMKVLQPMPHKEIIFSDNCYFSFDFTETWLEIAFLTSLKLENEDSKITSQTRIWSCHHA